MNKENPLYIYKDFEGVYVPKKENQRWVLIRRTLWIIFLLAMLFSLLFKDNLLSSIPKVTKTLLFLGLIGTLFITGREKVSSPFEIWFFEDHLVFYRDKHYYTKRVSRREYNTFYYKDIKKILYRKSSGKVDIFGTFEGVWFNYNKDGSLPDEPTYHKTVDSIIYFYTDCLQNGDFVSIFEKYCPVKVEAEES